MKKSVLLNRSAIQKFQTFNGQKMGNSCADNSPKILLVNDEQFTLTCMKNLFESKRTLEVHTALNGDLAVKLIQQNMVEFHEYKSGKTDILPKHFDAIILDLNMPIMGGKEACKQIKTIYGRFIDLCEREGSLSSKNSEFDNNDM